MRWLSLNKVLVFEAVLMLIPNNAEGFYAVRRHSPAAPA
jgi:hypothetical protein